MVKTVTSINGRLVKRRNARVSVFDNSLLYAEGLFETFLAIDDRVVFGKEHLQRLYNGARVIGLDIPAGPGQLTAWMVKTLRAHPSHCKKLRLTLTSGESARWVGHQGKPQVILSAAPHRLPEQPYSIHVSEFKVDHKSVFRRIKTLSYAIHATALNHAKKKGCDDALLLNQQNQVAEVTSANIYWVKKGKIYTPPLDSGCLDGVTRKIALREARKMGLRIIERNCTLSRMLKADEIFISSSLKLVLGVSCIKVGRRSYKFRPGPVTAEFSEHFNNLAGIDNIR